MTPRGITVQVDLKPLQQQAITGAFWAGVNVGTLAVLVVFVAIILMRK